jgi:hypothetical protein
VPPPAVTAATDPEHCFTGTAFLNVAPDHFNGFRPGQAVAEEAGHAGPDRIHRMLNRIEWDASIARLIFDEVAEAYDPADRAARDAASTTTWVRDFTLPYTSHRRERARRAARAQQLRNARGLDRLRIHLTVG